jgi:tRNA G26 N,N-dimethylase Trm1
MAKLKENGFTACRTHFDNHSVRTNASLEQLDTVIKELAV